MAFPYTVMANDKNLLSGLEEIIKREGISHIILGESKDFSGKSNRIMDDIEVFKKQIEDRIKLPVAFELEFLTSAQAERSQGKHKLLDASAAAIILQSFLDRNRPVI
jgi:RNase H-fold protein (predicted Holliday junction resolvase)